MKVFLVFVSILAVLGAVASYYVGNELDAQNVVLKFDRASSIACVICDVDVFVNGVKVGSVRNNSVEKFRLAPNPENTYKVMARLIPAVGPNSDSKTKVVKATYGSIVYARWEINPWVLKNTPEVRLEVAIEKDASRSGRFLPKSLERRGSQLVARLDKQKWNLPWDAIGAIAGVLGAIAAIVALFK
ncbi:MAG: hypothetical protein ABUT39_04745 [Acidobacteriota bacterium]